MKVDVIVKKIKTQEDFDTILNSVGTGRPEWGAKYGVNYFCITWEE